MTFRLSLNLGTVAGIVTRDVTVPVDSTNTQIGDVVADIQTAINSIVDGAGNKVFMSGNTALINVGLSVTGKIVFGSSGYAFSVTSLSTTIALGVTVPDSLGFTDTKIDATRVLPNISAVEANSSVTLDSSGRQQIIVPSLPTSLNGILSNDVSLTAVYDLNGTPITRSLTILAANTLSNGNVWGLANSIQLVLDAAGLSAIQVRVTDGKLQFLSDKSFRLTAGSHADLIGLATGATDSSLNPGGKLYLGGYVKSYNALQLYSGASTDSNDIEIDVAGRLETVNASIILNAGRQGWIKGELIAGGVGSDVRVLSQGTLRLSGKITASDEIEIRGGFITGSTAASVTLDPTAKLLAGSPTGEAGKITIYGTNDILLDTEIDLPNAASQLDINADGGKLTVTSLHGILNVNGYAKLAGYDCGHAGFGRQHLDRHCHLLLEIVADHDITYSGSIDCSGSLRIEADHNLDVLNRLTLSTAGAKLRVAAAGDLHVGSAPPMALFSLRPAGLSWSAAPI